VTRLFLIEAKAEIGKDRETGSLTREEIEVQGLNISVDLRDSCPFGFGFSV